MIKRFLLQILEHGTVPAVSLDLAVLHLDGKNFARDQSTLGKPPAGETCGIFCPAHSSLEWDADPARRVHVPAWRRVELPKVAGGVFLFSRQIRFSP